MLRYSQRIVEGLFVLNLLAIFYLDHVFTGQRPSKPTGEYVIEFPNHGTSTFITVAESRRYKLAWLMPFILVGIGMVLYQFEGPIDEIETPKPY